MRGDERQKGCGQRELTKKGRQDGQRQDWWSRARRFSVLKDGLEMSEEE